MSLPEMTYPLEPFLLGEAWKGLFSHTEFTEHLDTYGLFRFTYVALPCTFIDITESRLEERFIAGPERAQKWIGKWFPRKGQRLDDRRETLSV